MLFGKKATDEQLKPYLDRIHANPKVKKVYIASEILNALSWLMIDGLLFFILLQSFGLGNSSDPTYYYVMLMTNYTGYVFIGAYILLSITASILSKRVSYLESKIYRKIISGEENTPVEIPAIFKLFKGFNAVKRIITIAVFLLLIMSINGVI